LAKLDKQRKFDLALTYPIRYNIFENADYLLSYARRTGARSRIPFRSFASRPELRLPMFWMRFENTVYVLPEFDSNGSGESCGSFILKLGPPIGSSTLWSMAQ